MFTYFVLNKIQKYVKRISIFILNQITGWLTVYQTLIIILSNIHWFCVAQEVQLHLPQNKF